MGFAYELFDEPIIRLKDFTCSICSKVFDDPVELCSLEHPFCRSCIQPLRERGQTCPDCRQPMQNFPRRSKHLARLVQAFQRKCRNYSLGCKYIGVEGDGHVDECDYRLVRCTNHCSESVPYLALDAHKATCPTALIECPNRDIGCTTLTFRNQQSSHSAICEKIPCLYRAQGCLFFGTRAAVDAHADAFCRALNIKIKELQDDLATACKLHARTSGFLDQVIFESGKALAEAAKAEECTEEIVKRLRIVNRGLTIARKEEIKRHNATKRKLLVSAYLAGRKVKESERHLMADVVKELVQDELDEASIKGSAPQEMKSEASAPNPPKSPRILSAIAFSDTPAASTSGVGLSGGSTGGRSGLRSSTERIPPTPSFAPREKRRKMLRVA